METPQPHSRPSRSSKTAVTPVCATEADLSVNAQPFSPAATPVPDNKVRNVRPLKVRNVFENLDSVPFTPSQGICTPSPTNVATMWVANPFHAELSYQAMGYAHAHWGTLAPMISPGNHATCDSRTTVSDTSSIFTMSDGTSMPSSPFGSVPSYVMPVYYPVQYSPGHTSPEMNRMSAGSSSPGTPRRPSPGGFAGAGASPGRVGGLSVSPAAAYVGSPNVVALTHGRAIFAQYLAQEGYSHPQESGGGGHQAVVSSPGMDGRGGGKEGFKESFKEGRGVPAHAAKETASAIYTAQGLQGEPPCAVVELASLLVMFGMPATAAFLPVVSSGGTSPVKGGGGGGGGGSSKGSSCPNADGSVKLNARQRRTLRRAQERALAAMDEVRGGGVGVGGAPNGRSKKSESDFYHHHDESFDPHSSESTPMAMSPGQMYPGPGGTLPMARLHSGEVVAMLPPQVAMVHHHHQSAMPMQYQHHAMPAMPISPPPRGFPMHSMHAMPMQYHMGPYMQQQQQYPIGHVAGGTLMGAGHQQHQGTNRMQETGPGHRLSRFAPPRSSVAVR